MALTVPIDATLDIPAAAPAPAAPAIAPVSAPAYQPPVSVPMNPNPAPAGAPPGTYRGAGGTPFTTGAGITKFDPYYLMPGIDYRKDFPYGAETYEPITAIPGEGGLSYIPPPNQAYNPNGSVPNVPVIRLRPGEQSNVTPPPAMPPAKPGVAPNPTPVPVPGPISGTIAGYDLSQVPLWAWLVGAAVLGAALLK